MNVIELGEFGRCGPVELSPDAVSTIACMTEINVEPSRVRPGSWDVVGGHHVGVLRVGDLEIRIRPKVPHRRLLGWLTEAPDLIDWDDESADWSEASELLSTVTAAFCHYAERIVRTGMLQGYRTIEESSISVRGRLLVSAQVARRAGLVLPVEISRDNYTHDIVENQLLAGATRQLLRLGGVPDELSGRLRQLAVRFADVTPALPSRSVPNVTYSRLNERYRAGVTLARLILQSAALDDGLDRRSRGIAFLVDMNRVFEAVVGTRLKGALERIGGRVMLQHEDWLDDHRWLKFRPDLVWLNDDGSYRAVLDIKYSIPKDNSISSAHVYQVLAYAHRCGLDRVHLVYGAATAREQLTVGPTSIGLHQFRLDDLPSNAARAIDLVAQALATPVSSG